MNPLAGCDQTEMNQASPVIHVDADDPPMFLVHNSDDCNVPFLKSEEMAATLDNAVVLNQYMLTQGVHDFMSINLNVNDIIKFFRIGFSN